MARGYDEPFTLYGLLARSVETDAERSYVTFALDPAARFSDGKPVTAADVIFSWEILRDKGRPNFRTYYAKVAKAEALTERAVRFDLTGSDDRELPLILGLMPVLAKHAIDPATFEDTTFEPIVGSGPYVDRRSEARPQRDAQAQSDLLGTRPRDQSRLLEFRRDPHRLLPRRQRAFRGVQEGPLRRARRARSGPLGDRLRRPRGARRPHRQGGVADRHAQGHVRARLQHAARRSSPTFACARRSRCCSTSNGSTTISSSTATTAPRAISTAPSLSARGRPADARERALLAPFPDAVRADVLDGTWAPPVTDGSGRDRDTLKRALDLFEAAGFELVEDRAARPRDQAAVRLRDPGHHQGAGAPGDRLLRAISSAPASRCACASSTPCNTTAGASPTTST